MALPVRGIALSLLCLLALATDAAAQLSPPSRGANRGAVARGAARLLASPSAETIALEGAVDADAYLVGPGDVFSVTIGGGSAARQESATVSADGLLVVPDVGTFRAAERTLADVRADVRRGLRREYANLESDVALAVPRLFYVHVSGAVPLPGRHLVSAVGRVEDALSVATTDPEAPFDPRRPQTTRDLARYAVPTVRRDERRPALRNIRVTGREGEESSVDLARYFATGETDFNPVLRDGDAVHLPLFDPDREGIAVSGSVDRPGTYDWRPGDTALDLLVVTSGLDVERRIAAVRRTRRSQTGGVESVEVPLAEAGSLALQPRDGLHAVPLFPDAGLATVVGEGVRFPGTYPIEAGQTSLAALLEMAGGLAPDALLRGAYLERRARSEPEETTGAVDFADQLTSRGLDTTATDVADLSGFGLIGRRYYTQEVRRTPRVAVDVAAALRGGSEVVLQDGDRLVVPQDLGAVRVFGQVNGAGYVPYAEGQTAGDYLTAAGGLGPAATGVYVVQAGSGQFVEGERTPVQPGDAVFVAREPTSDSPAYEGFAFQERQIERQDRRDRRQDRYQLIQTTISAISTLFIAISVISTVSRSN